MTSVTRWGFAFVAFAAAAIVSALTTPLMGGPDEPAHTVKAVAVAHGELTTSYRSVRAGGVFAGSQPVTEVRVPAGYQSLGGEMYCWAFDLNTPASCAPALADRRGTRRAVTHMGAYPPLYYAVVGLPSDLIGPRNAIYAMRILGGLLMAALVASAVVSVRNAGSGWLGPAGLALAVTPSVVFLGGTVNPNGLEVSAALALWCGLLELLRFRGPPSRAAVLRVGVPAAVFAATRPLSPLLVAVIIALAAVVLAEPSQLRAWWTQRTVRVTALVVGGLAALAMGYVIAARALSAFVEFDMLQARSAGDVLRAAPGATVDLAEQMVGLLGWQGDGEVGVRGWAAGLWLGAAIALVVGAVVLARLRYRVGTLLLLAGVIALPVLSQLTNRGVGWQGRHSLPLAVGLPVLAGWALDRSGRVPVGVARVLAVSTLGMTVGVQVLAHQRYMTRVVVGLPNGLFDSFRDGTWKGPLSPVGLFVASVLASAAFAVVLLAPTQREVPAAGAGQGPAG